MINAIFSNGYSDAYKGDRNVKAAWMITRKSDGKVLASGHSLDVVTARKTAENNVASLGCSDLGLAPMHKFYLPRSAQYLIGASAKYLINSVREEGLADDLPAGKLTVREAFKRAQAFNARRAAALRAAVEVEVVAL